MLKNKKMSILNINNINSNPILKKFFILLLIELFLMGSGRMLKIGPITLRMVFFLFAIAVSIIIALRSKIDRYVYGLALTFIAITSLSTLVGLLNDASVQLIMIDIKPLIFFLIIIYFSCVIKNNNDILLIVRLIKISAVIMGLIYLIFLILMYFDFLDFSSVYAFVSTHSSDIMFRGVNNQKPELFYKGFLYLNIGFIFFIFGETKLDKIISLFLLIAIILTLTRGFILALFLSFLFQSLIDIKYKRNIIAFLIIFIIGLIATPFIMEIYGNRQVSDSIRIIQIHQVFENINFVSFFIGHGFGIGIPIRPIHMEIAFLEIFHKQGILGLLFWFYILGMVLFSYVKLKEKNSVSRAFFISTVFVYMQSATNPFLNNPIGMSIVLISLLSLIQIRKQEKIINRYYRYYG